MTASNTLAKEYWDRVVEIYKARLSVNVALALGMVTLTGYGLQSSRVTPLLISAVIPVIAFGVDFLIKWEYASPLFYKLVSLEHELGDSEPLGILFLDFARGPQSKYAALFEEPASENRRLAFRRSYVSRGLWVKLLLYIGIAVLEASFALLIIRT